MEVLIKEELLENLKNKFFEMGLMNTEWTKDETTDQIIIGVLEAVKETTTLIFNVNTENEVVNW